MTWKPATIDILTTSGPMAVQGWVCDGINGLAVTPEARWDGYRVTHTPSGYALPLVWDDAREVMDYLNCYCLDGDYSGDPDEELWEDLRRMTMDLWWCTSAECTNAAVPTWGEPAWEDLA